MSKSSVLPAGLTLVGEIEGRGDLVVAGAVEGPVDVEGGLSIEEGARVQGDVSATNVVVRGMLAGNAVATETIRVEPSAVVVGDVRAPRVNILDGARFRGRVKMTGEPLVPKAARRRKRRRSDREGTALQEGTVLEGLSGAAGPEEERPRAPEAAPRAEEVARGRSKRPKKRRSRKPPPPNIPTVQRQKARRKDAAAGRGDGEAAPRRAEARRKL